jgi:hypothetical protein
MASNTKAPQSLVISGTHRWNGPLHLTRPFLSRRRPEGSGKRCSAAPPKFRREAYTRAGTSATSKPREKGQIGLIIRGHAFQGAIPGEWPRRVLQLSCAWSQPRRGILHRGIVAENDDSVRDVFLSKKRLCKYCLLAEEVNLQFDRDRLSVIELGPWK